MDTKAHKEDTPVDYTESIHYRPSKQNGEEIHKAIAVKMHAETRSRNNCIEEIFLDYFKLKKKKKNVRK